jgi:hypothetical protein
MRSDSESLRDALLMFQDPETRGDGGSPAAHLGYFLAHGQLPQHVGREKVTSLWLYATEAYWNVSTAIDRLSWMKTRAADEEEMGGLWQSYAAADIRAIHVEMQSILDFLANLIRAFAPKPEELPEGSFRQLIDWCEKNPDEIPSGGCTLLDHQREWFDQFRVVRDLLVRLGGETVIYGSPEDGILFQVFRPGHQQVIRKSYLLHNPEAAYFNRYAALLTSRLLCFLHDIAAILTPRIRGDLPDPDTATFSPGRSVLQMWMKNLSVELSS